MKTFYLMYGGKNIARMVTQDDGLRSVDLSHVDEASAFCRHVLEIIDSLPNGLTVSYKLTPII